MTVSNPQVVGVSGGLPIIADLGGGLGHDVLVSVTLVQGYVTHHSPGYPFREEPGEHGPGAALSLLKPEADALVAAGVAVYASGEAGAEAPINVDRPYASGPSGGPETPHTLVSCTMGNWVNEPAAYEYQWYQVAVNGTEHPIAGEVANAYTMREADKNKSVRCRVTAINSAGQAMSASNDVACISGTSRAAQPENADEDSGSEEDETLHATKKGRSKAAPHHHRR